MAKTVSLRDKYKATPIEVLKSEIAEEDKTMGSSKRDGYHDIDDGLNKFRLYPKKEGEKTYYCVKLVHWISFEDGGETKRRSVYNARVHGGFKRDIIEEYVKAAQEKIKTDDNDPDTQAKKMKALTDWKTGLSGQMSWVAYADKIKRVDGVNVSDFGKLEFKRSVRDDLNTEAMMEDPDEPITVDPYTDPDDGKAILITYNSKAKKSADYYSTKIGKVTPLTDEQLEDFDSKKSLTELYTGVYRQEDFDLALKGLEFFDELHEIELFEDDSWLETVKAMKKEVAKGAVSKSKSSEDDEDEDEEEKIDKKKPSAKSKKKEVIEEEPDEEEAEEDEPEVEDEPEEESGDEFDGMTRAELVKYKNANDLDIKLLKSDTEDDMREKIRAAIKDSEPEEEAESEDDEEAEEKPSKAAGKESLASIKERIMSQKKSGKK